jgi:hypothetical protein
MRRRIVALVLLIATLTSCSYDYRLLAISQDGRLAFVVSPDSDHHPSCFRDVEVIADDGAKAKTAPEPGDDTSRVGYGTFWFQSVDYEDDCANRFPILYGASLKGQRQQYGSVKAKPLRQEVVYTVSTTSGATGYGGGRFVIHANGQIENLPEQASDKLVENAD